MRTLIALTLTAVAVTGCSSSGSSKPSGSTTGTHSTTMTTTYGEDAALLMSHIPGCQFVAAQELTDQETSSGMVGEASCKLDGHSVLLFTWKDAASSQSATSIIGGSPLHYSASGTGWSQIMGDDAAADAQKVVAETVAAALGGTVTAG